MEYYGAVNKANWDERVSAHAASPDYHVHKFLADPGYLSEVVRFDIPRLGDVSGQRGVHLQSHIGTDTISLARLGASMTGVDFSRPAVEQAASLAERTRADATFVESDVYEAASALRAADVLPDEGFDFVFTGIGALNWLPSVGRWANVVASLLRPGGRLFIREGHPMLWALQDGRDDDLLVVAYPYFERDEPTVFNDGGTYVETDHEFSNNETHEWSHGLGDIVTAVLAAGMTLTELTEHDSAPWDALPGQTVKDDQGECRLAAGPWRLPMTYTLQAVKPMP